MINVGGSGRIEFTAVDSSIAPPPYSERTVQLTQ
jgi:hypothetical protein